MIDYSEDFLNKYILENNLPKISILDFWIAYDKGIYSFYLKTNDIYPTDKIEIISNINEMTGEYVISANKRKNTKDLILNYFKKLNGEKSDLYTKNEYISKFLNPGKIAICIKNFERNECSNLVAISVKHFIPEAKIYLFNFYDERKTINLNHIDEKLYQDIINIPTKYILGGLKTDCSNARNNGLYYTEGFNWMYKYFQDYNGKLLMLDDNHFFTNGKTLQELLDNNFDIAWAFYSGVPPKLNGEYLTIPHETLNYVLCGGYINGSILCINPIKFKNIFPLPEYREYIEIILTEKLLNNNLIEYQIKNRYDGNYYNDGIYTNNAEDMKKMMIKYNILNNNDTINLPINNDINNTSKLISNSNKNIAIVIQGPSLYVNEVKNAWKEFKNNLIFSTWKGSENEYDENDIVIFNELPLISGPSNFNYQKISTYNGIIKAKELGYTHVLKIRSDYLPTNATEFINLLDFNKLNFLMWDYTTFLWSKYPTFNGYFDDHFSFGSIDNMIKLWDIPLNFCDSPETILTWNYINKLNNIDVKYILPYLNNNNNDLYYIKFDNINLNNCFTHNIKNTNFGNRELLGRYESIFKINSEFTKTPEETKKFMNNNYLNFLKYYNFLPKIGIINDLYNLNDIIYPKNKLEIITDINNTNVEYVIESKFIDNNATLVLEYFKKNKLIYINPNISLNENNDYISNLLTIQEYKAK